MRLLIAAIAGLILLPLSAMAQGYRCEHGELVGGNTGVNARCKTNQAGQIISVTPYRSTNRQTVRIYPNEQIRSQPVQTYTPKGKRVYAPAPLTPHANVPPADITRPGYSAQVQADPKGARIYRPSGSNLANRQTHIITAKPTQRIQRASYASGCSFKIREVKVSNDHSAYEVCYNDIEPTNKRSVRKLYARLKKASRRACGTDYDSILTRWSNENARCSANYLDQAVLSSGIDSLRAYHLSKTGRAPEPRVIVGPLRDAS